MKASLGMVLLRLWLQGCGVPAGVTAPRFGVPATQSILNEVAVTPSSTTPTEWPCARNAALPGRWVQKCCRGSGYPVFWHRAIRRVAVALSTLHRSEQRSGDGKVGHCANLLIPHLRGNKLVLTAGFYSVAVIASAARAAGRAPGEGLEPEEAPR